MAMQCQYCGMRFELPPESAGQVACCAGCGRDFTIELGNDGIAGVALSGDPSAVSSGLKMLIFAGIQILFACSLGFFYGVVQSFLNHVFFLSFAAFLLFAGLAVLLGVIKEKINFESSRPSAVTIVAIAVILAVHFSWVSCTWLRGGIPAGPAKEAAVVKSRLSELLASPTLVYRSTLGKTTYYIVKKWKFSLDGETAFPIWVCEAIVIGGLTFGAIITPGLKEKRVP